MCVYLCQLHEKARGRNINAISASGAIFVGAFMINNKE